MYTKRLDIGKLLVAPAGECIYNWQIWPTLFDLLPSFISGYRGTVSVLQYCVPGTHHNFDLKNIAHDNRANGAQYYEQLLQVG